MKSALITGITHCCRGHAFDEANTRICKRGFRHCRACMRACQSRFRERKRPVYIDADPKGEPTLSNEQWAYLAGIFDGEGSVILSPAYNKNGLCRTYTLGVTVVCGTHLGAISSIAALLNSNKKLTEITRYAKTNSRPAWRLRIYSRRARWFLRGVLRFLLIKNQQAELGIAHQTAKGGYQGAQCSDERAYQEAQNKHAMTVLNRRGRAAVFQKQH